MKVVPELITNMAHYALLPETQDYYPTVGLHESLRDVTAPLRTPVEKAVTLISDFKGNRAYKNWKKQPNTMVLPVS